jgi:hypothetical protein
MHQSLQGASFHVEHIVPRSRGGLSDLDNLAWACPGCNLHKADRVAAADATTGETVSLFHPRQQVWIEDFHWRDYHVVGLTACGRATVDALSFNHVRRLQVRQAEELFDLFPP